MHPRHDTRTVYGIPPKPKRPFRPNRLGATYYRGNWFRHPALFNGGNYRRATFHLSLCDSAGHRLAAGDSVETGNLVVRLELVRAAGNANLLFSDSTIAQWFLSSQDLTGPDAHRPSDELRFAPVESGRRWVADYPLAMHADAASGSATGLIYVYQAAPNVPANGPLYAECQYGISYALTIAERRLTAESDLWMGSLYLNDYLALPQSQYAPLEEWFDDRPIPELPDDKQLDPFCAEAPAPFAGFGDFKDPD